MPKIKGSHTAMKTGMLAAESVFEALTAQAEAGGEEALEVVEYETAVRSSWVKDELWAVRNVQPSFHKGPVLVPRFLLLVSRARERERGASERESERAREGPGGRRTTCTVIASASTSGNGCVHNVMHTMATAVASAAAAVEAACHGHWHWRAGGACDMVGTLGSMSLCPNLGRERVGRHAIRKRVGPREESDHAANSTHCSRSIQVN